MIFLLLCSSLVCGEVVVECGYRRVTEEHLAMGCREVLKGQAVDSAVVLGRFGRYSMSPCDS